jgi:DNA-binding beta-propeller fold protein YncE
MRGSRLGLAGVFAILAAGAVVSLGRFQPQQAALDSVGRGLAFESAPLANFVAVPRVYAAELAVKPSDEEDENATSRDLASPANAKVNSLDTSEQFLKVFARIPGGEIAPCVAVEDPYPEFNGIAIDPQNGVAVLSDTNLKSALIYDLKAGSAPDAPGITSPKGWVIGPATFLSFAAGVAVDPIRHELYMTENDIGDDIAAFPYTASGNFKARALAVPHGSYGIALSEKHHQMATAIQHDAEIIFYRLQAQGAEPPVRSIRGLKTKLADPHGVAWDEKNGELVVTNYGNWSRGYWDPDYTGGGHYYPPSIEVFKDDAKGDVAPLRVIQGPKTQLDWPTGISVDNLHNEMAIANEPANEVLVFNRTDQGDAAPIRVLGGPQTHIIHPMGVAFDPIHNELWVANFGHEAEIFDRTASGNVAPKRIVRNAPAGAPAAGFGNPTAMAYDSKRDELLVPN